MPPANQEQNLTPANNKACPWYKPLCQVTPVSKYLAAVIFIALPFVGGYIGYRLAPERVVEVPVLNSLANPITTSTTPVATTSKDTFGILNNPDVSIFAVKESEVKGDSRSYPVMGLYKKVSGKEVVKFATVGKLREYPINFAVSPDRKKVAVNLETRLVVVDTETGIEETLYTPKFVVGGRIAFSPDGSKLAFSDGNIYVKSDYAALYTVDIKSKQTTLYATSTNLAFVDANGWRDDNILIVSATAAKGCAGPVYKLYDLAKKVFTTSETKDFSTMSRDNVYAVTATQTTKPAVCENVDNMCDFAYDFDSILQVVDPVKKIKLGDFGTSSVQNYFIALSPDAITVLYASRPLPVTEMQCDNRIDEVTYLTKNFTTGEIKEVSDLGSVLEKWGITLINSESKIRVLTPYYSVKI